MLYCCKRNDMRSVPKFLPSIYWGMLLNLVSHTILSHLLNHESRPINTISLGCKGIDLKLFMCKKLSFKSSIIHVSSLMLYLYAVSAQRLTLFACSHKTKSLDFVYRIIMFTAMITFSVFSICIGVCVYVRI